MLVLWRKRKVATKKDHSRCVAKSCVQKGKKETKARRNQKVATKQPRAVPQNKPSRSHQVTKTFLAEISEELGRECEIESKTQELLSRETLVARRERAVLRREQAIQKWEERNSRTLSAVCNKKVIQAKSIIKGQKSAGSGKPIKITKQKVQKVPKEKDKKVSMRIVQEVHKETVQKVPKRKVQKVPKRKVQKDNQEQDLEVLSHYNSDNPIPKNVTAIDLTKHTGLSGGEYPKQQAATSKTRFLGQDNNAHSRSMSALNGRRTPPSNRKAPSKTMFSRLGQPYGKNSQPLHNFRSAPTMQL